VIGILAFIVAAVAGAVVMWWTFLGRGRAREYPITVTLWSWSAGCLTTLGLLLLFFGLASVFGLSS
jgi:hypothetical protein